MAWQSKCDGMAVVVEPFVQRDLKQARAQTGLVLMRELNAIEEEFWKAGADMCHLRRQLIAQLEDGSSPADDLVAPRSQKKAKKKKKQKSREEGEGQPSAAPGEQPSGADSPDILTSFEWYRHEPDPFSEPAPVASEPNDDFARISNAKSRASGKPTDPFQSLDPLRNGNLP